MDGSTDTPASNSQKWEELLYKFRWQAAFLLLGIIAISFGIFLSNKGLFGNSTSVEVLESGSESEKGNSKLVVEVVGAVNSPGVYKLDYGSRVQDLIDIAGGFSDDADMDLISIYVNRAAILGDAQKLIIPSENDQSASESANSSSGGSGTYGLVSGSGGGGSVDGSSTTQGSINVNTASQNQLESLWGIGPVTAQNIIEQRPYSSVEELLLKKILKANVYDRNKDLITVY